MFEFNNTTGWMGKRMQVALWGESELLRRARNEEQREAKREGKVVAVNLLLVSQVMPLGSEGVCGR